jgi:hypothetical protein
MQSRKDNIPVLYWLPGATLILKAVIRKVNDFLAHLIFNHLF